ncbi:Clr5 domain-containing protein [Fusarium acuminatum]|uniref:Clr5 domain-containing protein n=1 Tax=Fusarium acuminatum TaxID=5515 RepID=A0ABZ2WJ38_9HYPO
MVYQWEPHKDVCYQLYINERRPLEDIMVHMKNVYQFAPRLVLSPSFSRWKFPTKQRLKHKDDRLVKRIHDLWQKNVPQGEMLRILTDEDGFDINARELMRVRARNRWLLRVRHGDRARLGDFEQDDEALDNDSSPAEDGDVMSSLPDQEHGLPDHSATGNSTNSLQENSNSTTLAPKARKISKRQSRRNRQHLSEAEHIVRFPSEMTLNDSKDVLMLDASTYSETRECFAHICQEESIVKKTLAGPGRWDYVKNRLIHERPNLQQVLWISKENLERKQLALDIICTDVTKRIRNQETKMTLVDAKNELGLNPEESHDIRAALHEVLCDAQFTCKSDGTPEQWEELKKQWFEKSTRLKAIPLDGNDEQSRRKMRAIEIVARDVIKRKRDEKRAKGAKSGETAKQKGSTQRKSQSVAQESQVAHEEQPSQHQHQVQQVVENSSNFPAPEREAARSSSPASPALMVDGGMNDTMDNTGYDAIPESTNSQMNYAATRQSVTPHRPVQLQATNGILPQPHRMLGSSATTGVPMNSQYGPPSMYLGTQTQPNYMEQQYVPHQFSTPTPSTMFQSVPAVSASFAVFLRLHPSSTYVTNTNLWISTMASQSIQELRQAAVAKFPGALCVRIEGILKDPKGSELPLQIQGDDELGAYFAHMQGGSPTFAVQLV